MGVMKGGWLEFLYLYFSIPFVLTRRWWIELKTLVTGKGDQ